MRREIGLCFPFFLAAASAFANPIPEDDDYEYPDYDEDLIENIFVRGDGSACVVIFIAGELYEAEYKLERIYIDESQILF